MSLIISLIGIDGCGKSTLAHHLKNKLKNKGQKSVVVWATLKPVLLKPIIVMAKYVMVRKHNKYDNYEDHMTAKRAGMNKWAWANQIYFIFMLIDYVPQIIFKVLLQRCLGRIVICDRYFYDLIIDYGLTINTSSDKIMKYLYFAKKIFPSADLCYYLNIPPKEAMIRKNDIPAIEYLEDRADIYDIISDGINAVVLDGCESLEKNGDIILEDIEGLKGK